MYLTPVVYTYMAGILERHRAPRGARLEAALQSGD